MVSVEVFEPSDLPFLWWLQLGQAQWRASPWHVWAVLVVLDVAGTARVLGGPGENYFSVALRSSLVVLVVTAPYLVACKGFPVFAQTG